MEFKGILAQYETQKEELNQAVLQVCASGEYIDGTQVKKLEQKLADCVGVNHCITCGNGTDALYIILKFLGIGPGDGVLVPSFTFFATGEVVAQLGAMPIFVDVSESTYNIDCTKLEDTISKVQSEGRYLLKAIISVDLFGKPAEYDKLQIIAQKYNLALVEDAAQSFGASYKGKMCGSFGIGGATSFFPAKPLGCYGDGGAIFTNDNNLSEFARSCRCHGKGIDKYHNEFIGLNSRLDEIQAAILTVKLKTFTGVEMARISDLSKFYNKNLSPKVVTPFIKDDEVSVYAQYTIQLCNNIHRGKIIEDFIKQGIPWGIYYSIPLHQQKAFQGNPLYGKLDVSERLPNRVLSLPFHPYLTEEEAKKVCDTVNSVVV